METPQVAEVVPTFTVQEVMFGDGLALVCPRNECGFVEVVALAVLTDYIGSTKPCAVCGIGAKMPRVEVIGT